MNSNRKKAANRVPLPDGADISAYDGWETWDYTRYAWEYLRRNDEFRSACEELQKFTGDDRDAKKREITERFLLGKYRHCDAQIAGGKSIAFQALQISPFKPESTSWQMQLKNYQAAIVFDLRPSLYAKDAVKVQLDNARNAIEKRLSKLRQLDGSKGKAAATTIKRAAHLHRLRVLDARRAGRSWEEIADLLQTEADRNIDIADRVERVRKDYKAAKDLVEFGYLKVLASSASRTSLPRDALKPQAIE